MLLNSNGSLERSDTQEVDLRHFPIEIREYISYRAPASMATLPIFESLTEKGIGMTFVMLVATSLKSIVFHYPTATTNECAAMLGHDIVSVIGIEYFERLLAKVRSFVEQENSDEQRS